MGFFYNDISTHPSTVTTGAAADIFSQKCCHSWFTVGTVSPRLNNMSFCWQDLWHGQYMRQCRWSPGECVCVCLTHADVRSYVCTWHFLLQNGKDHSQTEVVSSSDTLTSTFYPQSCTTVTVQQLTLYLLNLMLKMYLWWYLILLSTQIRITVCNCSFLCVANINGHLQQMKYVKG